MTTAKKVSILTGFLGAGKTTLLNEILKQRNDLRFAIIENEFGEEGIDNELLINPTDELIEMNNGCLCCTLNDNLYDILNALHQRSSEFDELIIESTGIADPVGIAEPFLNHPLLIRHFPLQRVICLVDAALIEKQLSETEEAIKQIAFSDMLLINKIEGITATELQKLQALLQGINPLAKILVGSKGNYPIQELFEIERNHLETEMGETATNFPISQPKHHHHHKHGTIVSLSFSFTEIFDIQKLRLRLYQFLFLQSEGLYRMKGVFFMENNPHKIIFQAVGNKLNVEEGKAWAADEEKISRMVFIGKNLNETGYEKMMRQCLK